MNCLSAVFAGWKAMSNPLTELLQHKRNSDVRRGILRKGLLSAILAAILAAMDNISGVPGYPGVPLGYPGVPGVSWGHIGGQWGYARGTALWHSGVKVYAKG